MTERTNGMQFRTAVRAVCVVAGLALGQSAIAQDTTDQECMDAWNDSRAANYCSGVSVGHDGSQCILNGGSCEITVNVAQENGDSVPTTFRHPGFAFSGGGSTAGHPEETREYDLCLTNDRAGSGWILDVGYNVCAIDFGVDSATAEREGLPYVPSGGASEQ